MRKLIALYIQLCALPLLFAQQGKSGSAPEIPAPRTAARVEVTRNGETELRDLVVHEVSEYDEQGRVIRTTDRFGEEHITEYNQNGDIIYYQSGSDDKGWYTYDESGRRISCSYISSYEDNPEELKTVTFSYADDGSMHGVSTTGEESWATYEDNGRTLHFWNSNGYEYWETSDSEGRVTLLRFRFNDEPEPRVYSEAYEYDLHGNTTAVYSEGEKIVSKTLEYDTNGYLSYQYEENLMSFDISEYWYENILREDGTLWYTICYEEP